jgi:hypothetical protein
MIPSEKAMEENVHNSIAQLAEPRPYNIEKRNSSEEPTALEKSSDKLESFLKEDKSKNLYV